MATDRLTIYMGIGQPLELDVTITEKHRGQVTITKHPVEKGVNPADHALVQPDVLSFEGLITNTPLSQVDRDQRGVSVDRLSSTGRPLKGEYANTQYQRLKELKTARRAVQISTSLDTYRDMLLTSIDVNVDSKSGDSIRFSCTFEQIVFVENKRVKLPPVPKDIKKPTKKNDQGKKSAEPFRSGAKSIYNAAVPGTADNSGFFGP